MPVFVSHSFENKPQFENIADALRQAGVEFWTPEEIRPGSSLRDQLRSAVESCAACIFVATKKSLKSAWCGSELGAFWGAGKPIVVWVAEPSLTDKELPPIVQGDVWEQKISPVVKTVKQLLASPNSTAGANTKPPTVGSMTAEQLERLINGAVSLAFATSNQGGDSSMDSVDAATKGAVRSVVASLQDTRTGTPANRDANIEVLWVDDRPANNIYERRAFEAIGITFTLAESTNEALDILATRSFAAIISDMGRREGPQEGYVLLQKLRSSKDTTPFFIYAGSNSPEHKRLAAARGAQGCTNNPQELFDLLMGQLRATAPR